jgi:HNH endonuclease
MDYKHNYINGAGYNTGDRIPCEIPGCNNEAVNIHHVIPRSHFGKKRRAERDSYSNLIALCFFHHDLVHCRGGNQELKDKIKEIVKNR